LESVEPRVKEEEGSQRSTYGLEKLRSYKPGVEKSGRECFRYVENARPVPIFVRALVLEGGGAAGKNVLKRNLVKFTRLAFTDFPRGLILLVLLPRRLILAFVLRGFLGIETDHKMTIVVGDQSRRSSSTLEKQSELIGSHEPIFKEDPSRQLLEELIDSGRRDNC
jgi:hypothetical protein